MKIVSILNHKGGVGKTTFTGSCAQALALTGFRALAIDNDGQHNLSTMLGTGVNVPNICDIYRAEDPEAASVFLRSIRSTDIPGLHIVTSQAGLADADIRRSDFLRDCIVACRLERFYDYILIDNAPGMGMLQEAAVCASDEIFVPTELKLFAVDGITEMQSILTARFPQGPGITKIIPQFCRNTKRQNSYRAALEKLFPGQVTRTGIPVDSVFDELVVEKKILFLHRLYSRGAAYYLKVMHEVFDLDEKQVWETLASKRKRRLREEAVDRLIKIRQNKENRLHEDQKNNSTWMQDQQRVSATAGEQVFGDTSNEILVDKIVKRTRENASGAAPIPETRKAEDDSAKQSKRPGVLNILAVCAVLGGIAVLVVRSLTHQRKKRKHRHR